jgi:hypothetical protein
MANLTRLLEAADSCDRQTAAKLLPLESDEPRKIVAKRMTAEPAGHTLQPAALLQEAYPSPKLRFFRYRGRPTHPKSAGG